MQAGSDFSDWEEKVRGMCCVVWNHLQPKMELPKIEFSSKISSISSDAKTIWLGEKVISDLSKQDQDESLVQYTRFINSLPDTTAEIIDKLKKIPTEELHSVRRLSEKYKDTLCNEDEILEMARLEANKIAIKADTKKKWNISKTLIESIALTSVYFSYCITLQESSRTNLKVTPVLEGILHSIVAAVFLRIAHDYFSYNRRDNFVVDHIDPINPSRKEVFRKLLKRQFVDQILRKLAPETLPEKIQSFFSFSDRSFVEWLGYTTHLPFAERMSKIDLARKL